MTEFEATVSLFFHVMYKQTRQHKCTDEKVFHKKCHSTYFNTRNKIEHSSLKPFLDFQGSILLSTLTDVTVDQSKGAPLTPTRG